MKRIMGFVLAALLLMPLAGFINTAQAMTEAEAAKIVAASDQAVQNSLSALQKANESADLAKIDLALQSLNLAIQNYATASDNLAMIRAGETVDDATLNACSQVADKLNSVSVQLADNNVEGARTTYTEASQTLAAASPAPIEEGIPAGLEGMQTRIIAASAEATTSLRSAGTAGGGEGGAGDSETGSGTIGTNTQVGSPI